MNRKHIRIFMIAAVMMLAGCGSKEEKQVEVINADQLQEQEISSVEETQQTDVVMEETQQSAGEEETEIIVEGNKGTITIGTIGAPYDELLTQAKIILAKEGWDVQVKTYTDHRTVNQDVLDGNIDAHLFTHQTYLDSYNDVNGTTLTAVAPVCFEKYGVYSVLNDDLTKISTGAAIGIPSEDTKKARALLFLEELGYISLKEGVGLTAILEDIVENPHNIQFVEYTTDTAKEVLQQTDYCVMGGDQAILAGLEPHKEVLTEENLQMNSARSMAALLVTTADNVENEKLLILIEALQSETVQKYVKDTYKEAVGLFF